MNGYVDGYAGTRMCGLVDYKHMDGWLNEKYLHRWLGGWQMDRQELNG